MKDKHDIPPIHEQQIAVGPPQASVMCGVSLPTIYGWLKAGFLPSVLIGRNRRILIADIERLLRAGKGA